MQVRVKKRLAGSVECQFLSLVRNWSKDTGDTTEAGRWFHRQIPLGKKECWYARILQWGCRNCKLCPLVDEPDGKKMGGPDGMAMRPWTIRYIMMVLLCVRLSLRVYHWRSWSISVTLCLLSKSDLTKWAARLWPISSWDISFHFILFAILRRPIEDLSMFWWQKWLCLWCTDDKAKVKVSCCFCCFGQLGLCSRD